MSDYNHTYGEVEELDIPDEGCQKGTRSLVSIATTNIIEESEESVYESVCSDQQAQDEEAWNTALKNWHNSLEKNVDKANDIKKIARIRDCWILSRIAFAIENYRELLKDMTADQIYTFQRNYWGVFAILLDTLRESIDFSSLATGKTDSEVTKIDQVIKTWILDSSPCIDGDTVGMLGAFLMSYISEGLTSLVIMSKTLRITNFGSNKSTCPSEDVAYGEGKLRTTDGLLYTYDTKKSENTKYLSAMLGYYLHQETEPITSHPLEIQNRLKEMDSNEVIQEDCVINYLNEYFFNPLKDKTPLIFEILSVLLVHLHHVAAILDQSIWENGLDDENPKIQTVGKEPLDLASQFAIILFGPEAEVEEKKYTNLLSIFIKYAKSIKKSEKTSTSEENEELDIVDNNEAEMGKFNLVCEPPSRVVDNTMSAILRQLELQGLNNACGDEKLQFCNTEKMQKTEKLDTKNFNLNLKHTFYSKNDDKYLQNLPEYKPKADLRINDPFAGFHTAD